MIAARWFIALVVAMIASPISADDPTAEQAKSSTGRAVFAKRESAVKKALAAYRAAMNEADKQLIVDVDAALKRPGVSKDSEANSELLAAKKSAQERMKETKSASNEAEFPIISATYGSVDKSVDVMNGVRHRLAKGQDLWVDKNISDGRLESDGDLRLVIRSAGGKPIVIVCRHSSRVFITR